MRTIRLAAILTALVVVSPILGLLTGLVNPAPDPLGGTSPAWSDLWTRGRVLQLLANSLILSIGATVTAVVAGGGLAWAEQRVAFPGRRWLSVLSLLPLAMPSYIVAATSSAALSPGGAIGDLLGLPRATGLGLAIVVIGVVCAPYVQLLVGAALARSSAAEEEAARLLGARPWRVFCAVVLPGLRPAIALSALLSLLYAVSDFGAVAVLDCPVLTWRLYEAVQGQELARATLLGMTVLGVTAPLFVLARMFAGGRIGPGVANPRPPMAHRPNAGTLSLIYLGHTLVIGLGVALPTLTMAGWVADGLQRSLPFASPWLPLGQTILISVVGALVTGLLAFAPAWIAARDRPALAEPVTHATLMTSALPGVLLALGLVLAALSLSGAVGGRTLYAGLAGSGVLLLAGYVVRFLAEGFAALRSAIVRLDPRQEAAARSLGATPARWFRTVALPDLAPGVAASALLLFLAIFKELPVTLLLGGALGLQTLAFRVWDRYSEALWHDAGLAGLLLVAVALIAVGGTLRWRRSV